MILDYNAIGQRVRSLRLKLGITQQVLAEISEQTSTNISHIERGKTKLSLPTLVKIANSLSVSVDELLCDSIVKSKIVFHNEIANELKDCNEKEIRIIADVVKSLKLSLRKKL